jgi:K+-sensing histidine kinase KdpD/membrane protein YdbS with pleckstrin-like domain
VIRRLQRISPVWFLSGALAVLAVAIVPFAIAYDAPTLEPRLSWPIVALGFYLAEIAVLHLRFRRDAQSFSMSEIAITVGLFFATPTAMLIGQFVGNAVALILNRRQPPMKLVFNLAQFTVQIGAAIIAFNLVLGDGDPFSPRGWIAALAGNLAAFAISDVSVNTAIKMAGGSLSRGEAWTVRWLTTGAAVMNTILGIVIVLVWSTQPAAAILALAPPVMLYLAYLAYTLQRAQQARVEALQNTAQALLHAHTLADVASLAADQARAMFEAELAEVAILPSDDRAGLQGVALATKDVEVHTGAEPPGRVKQGEALLLQGSALQPYLVSDTVTPASGMVVSIDGEDGAVGFVVVVNPLSDVASYDASDLGLLETLSGQIGPIVENERLGGEVAALAELVDSRNQVLAAVSHEVRSPLATVVSAAATLEGRMAELSAENRKVLVDLIRKNSQELTEIVDDLLVAARGDSASESIETQPVDPASEIAALAATLEDLSGETAVKGNSGLAMADPTRFRQIMRNLLTNATRYGGESIWVELEDGPASVAISVCDDGSGVPEELTKTIFEPYVSAHEKGGQPQALGLGLAISRRLARLMAGDVTYSRTGDVTRFTLTLAKA